jgi:branched-chain amino acid transport system ATP-binding protein
MPFDVQGHRPRPQGILDEAVPQLAAHALELHGVSRRYGAVVALDDVSLAVAAGERRAIIGANGAGKTTLFNTVTGDFSPTSGRIVFFGEDVTRLAPHERIRRGLRRTYQSSMLFQGLSVLENLYLAGRGITRGRHSLTRPRAADPAMARARDLARGVHLDAVGDRLVAALSHGQKRQLEIGMALVGAPRLILFDEPAAGLSPAERRDLLLLLRSLPSHTGYVVIEHDLDIALAVAERVTVMHRGRIFKEGSPTEIERDPDVQAIYLGGHHG